VIAATSATRIEGRAGQVSSTDLEAARTDRSFSGGQTEVELPTSTAGVDSRANIEGRATYDYYRVRFRKLLGPQRPTSLTTLDGPKPVRMPAPLRFVYTVSCVMVALGWLATVALGRAFPLGGEYPWLVVLVLVFPVFVALALGFNEQQSWTRPLMLLLLFLPAAALAPFGFAVVRSFLFASALCASLAALMLCAGAYLYISPAVRSYYAYLRETAMVRIEKSDLRGALLIPVYTAIGGILIGAWLGYYIVTRHLGYASGLGAHDITETVCVGTLFASLLGVVGRWIGEALVSRLSRAA
jgi:hypothetical protein